MNYLASLEFQDVETKAPETRQGGWTAIVLAGQRPGTDPLAAAFGETHKALVQIAGQSMLSRVLRTMLAAPSIGRIVVLAQQPEALLAGPLGWATQHPRIVPMISTGGIAQSIADVAGSRDAPWPAFVTTADHPLLTVELVECFLGRADETDISVGAVEQSTVQARYPACKRTWLKFSDGAYSGANMFALRNSKTAAALRLWSAAEQDRKNAVRLFLHFGPRLAARAITRTIGFDAAIAAAGRKLGVSARLIALDDPDAAIDVDKPGDHQLAEAILRSRAEKSATPAPSHAQLSIFDLDRTLTRKPTYTAFLAFAALRHCPWRLALAPCVVACMLAYLAGFISRRRVKELEQALVLGRRISRREIASLADRYAHKIARKGISPAGLARIRQERAEGRQVIMATAANAFYLDAIARRIGIEDVVATRSMWDGDDLLARIDGENCYGAAKRDMVCAYLETRQLCREQTSVRFFSDHVSDLPTFEWADEAIAVNPSPALRKVACERNWPVLRWA